MTYLTIDHPFYHEQSTANAEDNEVFVIFISNDEKQINYAVITTAVIKDGLTAVWVPAEVTISDREN